MKIFRKKKESWAAGTKKKRAERTGRTPETKRQAIGDWSAGIPLKNKNYYFLKTNKRTNGSRQVVGRQRIPLRAGSGFRDGLLVGGRRLRLRRNLLKKHALSFSPCCPIFLARKRFSPCALFPLMLYKITIFK